MDATMLTVDRLIDGINGEDHEGARHYMAQLRRNETLSILECFEDMLSGRLPVDPESPPAEAPSSRPRTSLAYRVPPCDFLKVLVAGNTTRLGAVHAVLQAIGRGDLQGRAASLCISEVRMCLAAFAGGATSTLFAGEGQREAERTINRRVPLGQLWELARVCLVFSIDFLPVAGSERIGALRRAGRGQGEEHANNRRILMLNALPAVLGACIAAAAAEDDDSSSEFDSEPDRDNDEDDIATSWGLEETATGAVKGGSRGSEGAAAVSKRKSKGKAKRDVPRGRMSAQGRRRSTGGIVATADDCRRLPERGEAVLTDVINSLLERPWPPELALPLLVMFEEIYGLVEMLGVGRGNTETSEATATEEPARLRKSEAVWTRVRSRLMECVWMGGLDGADFTGILRQVCVLCMIDGQRGREYDSRQVSTEIPLCLGGAKAGCIREEDEGGSKVQGCVGKEGHSSTGSCLRHSQSLSWLSCLRRLHAAVPPEWLSTVELVLEQTLHQMPEVAEALLDAIKDADESQVPVAIAGTRAQRTNAGSRGLQASHRATSMSDDLGFLLLLLREASPLRACSLPLLPDGMDRGGQAEEGVRRLLRAAARRSMDQSKGETSAFGTAMTHNRAGHIAGMHNGLRALLQQVLCSHSMSIGRASGGSGSLDTDAMGRGSSGVASERASQLLELSLQWLEERRGVVVGHTPTNGVSGAYCGLSSAGGGGGSGGSGISTDPTMEDIASEVIATVFDAVPGARPRLLRALISGVFDQSQGGATSAPSFLRAWEVLMVQEAQKQCRRLLPHSQVVSDALGRLTLLPRGRARRVVESMLPLADACPVQASALISLCRKCSAKGRNKDRLLTLHAVACIFAWNARHAATRVRGSGGHLDQEGMREDLVGMFRRAFHGGLQTAARADILDVLAGKVAKPGLEHFLRSLSSALPRDDGQLPPLARSLSMPRAASDPDGRPVIALSVLRGLRGLLAKRLFRFLAHKDDVLDDADSSSDRAGARADAAGGRKGKQKARRRRSGLYRLIPLRLLEYRAADARGSGHARGTSVTPRDPIGHLVRCCWALVPPDGCSADSRARIGYGGVGAGPSKRAEAEAVARTVLGTRSLGSGGMGGCGGGATDSNSVRTREGEALVAVVEFLETGGRIETVRTAASPAARTTKSSQDWDDQFENPVAVPDPCNPGVVGPLPALSIVVSLAEALVDCLLSGLSCPPETPYLRPTPRYAAMLSGRPIEGGITNVSGHNVRESAEAMKFSPLVLWATADVFTVLAAATRTADGIAGAGGFTRQSKSRMPEGISEMIGSLPAETLGLCHTVGDEPLAALAGAEGDDDGTKSGRTSSGVGGSGGGGRDASSPPSLMSASSAIVFTNDFLQWAQALHGASSARIIAEGWDAGTGVWLGLTHCVRALTRTFENPRRSISGGDADGSPAAVRVASWELVAFLVFELRTLIGTPAAAAEVLDASFVSGSTNSPAGQPSASSTDDQQEHEAQGFVVAGDDNVDRLLCSRRPPSGKMAAGFLKRMSDRWKAHLDWGLPGRAPARRTSARLEKSADAGSRSYRGDNVAQSLRAEAEDLFFALRGELLRAERLVLSILLAGPDTTPSSREWAMRAALDSARRRCSGSGGQGPEPRLCTKKTSAEEESAILAAARPEAGSGPARVASPRPRVTRRGRKSNGARANGAMPPEGSTRMPKRQGTRCGNHEEERDSGGRSADHVTAGPGEDENELGSLCLLIAKELREGLENGLSVKLTQAYLDQVELLGYAALEQKCLLRGSPERSSESLPAASEVGTALPSVECKNDGVAGHEDAGDVLMSILTCHSIGQVTLLKRLIRGALCFEGVGSSRNRHPRSRRASPDILAELERIDKRNAAPTSESTVAGREGSTCGSSSTSGGDGCRAVTVIATKRPPAALPPPLDRCSRLLKHCVEWTRTRSGGRKRSSTADGNSGGGTASDHIDASRVRVVKTSALRVSDAEQEEEEGGGNDRDSDGAPEDGLGEPRRRYSARPEDVRFSTSRECHSAMQVALLELETALSSAVEFGSGGTAKGGIIGRADKSELADVIHAATTSLRKCFEPNHLADCGRRRKDARGTATSASSAEVGATSAAGQRLRTTRSGSLEARARNDVPCSTLSLDLLPEHLKLLVVRVLERLNMVCRAAAQHASAVLAKRATVSIATLPVPVRDASPPPLLASPRTKRRRRQEQSPEKSGDRAGGSPATTTNVGRYAATISSSKIAQRGQADGDPSIYPSTAVPSPRILAGTDRVSSNRVRTEAAVEADMVHADIPSVGGTTPRLRLLAMMLPTAATVSRESLCLMAAARAWAEVRRARNRRGEDDPCRKRASTLLFKMDRCELEIEKAAHSARQFLEYFAGDVRRDSAKAERTSDEADGGRGHSSAKKRARGTAVVGDVGNMVRTREAEFEKKVKCDEATERALRLLLAGAETLAAWRRDSSAKEKKLSAPRRQGGRSKGQLASRGAEGASDDSEEDSLPEKSGNRGVLGARRKSRANRIRSRNAVIDQWLAEGFEEGDDRGDAFVDLEDFIDG